MNTPYDAEWLEYDDEERAMAKAGKPSERSARENVQLIERLKRQVGKLSGEVSALNQRAHELDRLQTTYGVVLSGLLFRLNEDTKENLVKYPQRAGREITYYLPLDWMKGIEASEINIESDEEGAFISLVLPERSIENGKKENEENS